MLVVVVDGAVVVDVVLEVVLVEVVGVELVAEDEDDEDVRPGSAEESVLAEEAGSGASSRQPTIRPATSTADSTATITPTPMRV